MYRRTESYLTMFTEWPLVAESSRSSDKLLTGCYCPKADARVYHANAKVVFFYARN